MRPDTQLLTRQETADRLHVSVSTVKRLVRSGILAESRVGKRSVRYEPNAVQAAIRRVIREGTAPIRGRAR